MLEGRHIGNVKLPRLVQGSAIKETVVQGEVGGRVVGNGSNNRGDVRVGVVGLLDGRDEVGIQGDKEMVAKSARRLKASATTLVLPGSYLMSIS